MRSQRDITQKGPKLLDGLSSLIQHYDGLIIDLWGVIHDGNRVYEGVIECLKELKACHKQIVFLSNAPRRKSIIQSHLAKMELSKTLYADLLTSGRSEEHTPELE